MKIVSCQSLTQAQLDELLTRPALYDNAQICDIVTKIMQQVQADGDEALLKLTQQYDDVTLTQIEVSKQHIDSASSRLNDEIKIALKKAYDNIASFHRAQLPSSIAIETTPGVLCEQLTLPIQKVGLYVPGGSAPLVSTALMLGVPSHIAANPHVMLCSPPPICDEILYVAHLCGIDKVYQIGGAQAIAAMAYGTHSIAKVDKIFGPGNAYVTQAKQQVSHDINGVAIDMPAGPSELLIIADKFADPRFIAADLLSQAEHGPDSQVILVTTSNKLAQTVNKELTKQLKQLSRKDIATKSLAQSITIITKDLIQCAEISNQYAPEHLIINTQNPRQLLALIEHAGSVFLGPWSPESVGDYASGTNHVLPTYGATRNRSCLGLADFYKRMTVQEISKQGLKTLAPTVITMANIENLQAHSHAIAIRMDEK